MRLRLPPPPSTRPAAVRLAYLAELGRMAVEKKFFFSKMQEVKEAASYTPVHVKKKKSNWY